VREKEQEAMSMRIVSKDRAQSCGPGGHESPRTTLERRSAAAHAERYDAGG